RDSRGVPYRFWTVGFWWKSSTGHYSYLLERFNKQKPRSFEKETAPFFPRAEQERLKREYHSIRQTDTETST
nr:hypothetical protein [Tanacetum cinerariifolium]